MVSTWFKKQIVSSFVSTAPLITMKEETPLHTMHKLTDILQLVLQCHYYQVMITHRTMKEQGEQTIRHCVMQTQCRMPDSHEKDHVGGQINSLSDLYWLLLLVRRSPAMPPLPTVHF